MKKKNKAVLVGGCFDVLHVGHIDFLKKAKTFGDKLIVALEPDEKIKLLKGSNRPINPQLTRYKMLMSLKYVDKVIMLPLLNTDEDYLNLVKKIRPNIIAVTRGDPILEKKKLHAKAVGARIVKIPKTEYFSTSELTKKLLT